VIVLDTHTLVWWLSGQDDLLSDLAIGAINAEMPGGEILVSSISAWEIATLVSKGRLALTMDVTSWLDTAAEIEALRFVPVDNELAVKSTELPGEFHKDPADRIIVATARKFAAQLVTADEKIRNYEHVRVVW